MDTDAETFWDRLSQAFTEERNETITQEKAGSLIGSGQSAARKWEHGGLPSMRNCVKIALKLNRTVDWLYTGRGDPKPLSKTETECVQAFREIGDHDDQMQAIGWLKGRQRKDPSRRPFRVA